MPRRGNIGSTCHTQKEEKGEKFQTLFILDIGRYFVLSIFSSRVVGSWGSDASILTWQYPDNKSSLWLIHERQEKRRLKKSVGIPLLCVCRVEYLEIEEFQRRRR